MINERMTFCLKYGKEEAASQIWKEMLNSYPPGSAPREIKSRVYQALTGRTNTVVQDFLIKSINDHNPMMYYWVTNTQVQQFYRQFVEYCDCSEREMFKIEHETGKITDFRNHIAERNTFRLVFGKAKDSIAIWMEILEETAKAAGPHLRMMTDIVGPSYTLQVEAFYPSMQQIHPRRPFWTLNDKLNELHNRFVPLCSSARRDYFIVEQEVG